MECRLDWSIGDGDAWEAAYAAAPRAPLLQSPAYAAALCPAQGQRPRRAWVEIDGIRAGVVQVQEAGLFGRAIHALILDRGPVWAEGAGSAQAQRAFWAAMAGAFPARAGRRRRFLPELDERRASAVLPAGDMRVVPGRPGYQTIWVDLRPDADVLRARLAPKWRNMLSKAERAGVEVAWDWSGLTLPLMLARYEADRRARGYPGPDPGTLARLGRGFAAGGALGLGLAMVGDVPAAGVMIAVHGGSATFQMGWVAEAGRASAANHLALWQAMLELRARGVRDFDLGGVNDEGGAGVKRFKSGLGGELVRLAGQYR